MALFCRDNDISELYLCAFLHLKGILFWNKGWSGGEGGGGGRKGLKTTDVESLLHCRTSEVSPYDYITNI